MTRPSDKLLIFFFQLSSWYGPIIRVQVTLKITRKTTDSRVYSTGTRDFIWSGYQVVDFVSYVGSYSRINYFLCTQIGNHCHNTNSVIKVAMTSHQYTIHTLQTTLNSF
jgi:hypothetical protein